MALFIQAVPYLVRDIRHIECDVVLPAVRNPSAAVDSDLSVLPGACTVDAHDPAIVPRLLDACPDHCQRSHQGVGVCIVPWFNAVLLPSVEVVTTYRRS